MPKIAFAMFAAVSLRGCEKMVVSTKNATVPYIGIFLANDFANKMQALQKVIVFNKKGIRYKK